MVSQPGRRRVLEQTREREWKSVACPGGKGRTLVMLEWDVVSEKGRILKRSLKQMDCQNPGLSRIWRRGLQLESARESSRRGKDDFIKSKPSPQPQPRSFFASLLFFEAMNFSSSITRGEMPLNPPRLTSGGRRIQAIPNSLSILTTSSPGCSFFMFRQ